MLSTDPKTFGCPLLGRLELFVSSIGSLYDSAALYRVRIGKKQEA